MKKNLHNQKHDYTLLVSLQQLFRELAMSLVQLRLQAYRAFIKSDAKMDPATTIVKRIGQLAERSRKQQKHGVSIEHDTPEINHTVAHEHEYRILNTTHSKNELAEHLVYVDSHATAYHKSLADKLRLSVRQHINSAVRFARQGDTSKAKLHSRIAVDALEEIHHYVSDESYAQLVEEIDQHLQDVQASANHHI